MNTTKTAEAVLSEAEANLRELVGRAAADGEYDVAVRIATIAKNVAMLGLALDSVGSDPGAASAAVAANALATLQPAVPRPASADGEATGGEATRSPARARSSYSVTPRRPRRREANRTGRASNKRAPRKGLYPKFYRDGDCLVKVAWSKKERGEYQHKAPRRVAELLVAAIEKRSGNGRLFTSDDIFPLKDPESGGDVPSYQAYAALAWFKASGFVRPHGRQGYTAGHPGKLLEAVTAGWEKLREAPS